MTKRLEVGYKVLTHNRISCASAFAIVSYRKMRRTLPKNDCGPLAVFKDRESAQNFIINELTPYSIKNYLIVKCKYKKSTQRALWRWGGTKIHPHFHIPGTDYADWVTCLE